MKCQSSTAAGSFHASSPLPKLNGLRPPPKPDGLFLRRYTYGIRKPIEINPSTSPQITPLAIPPMVVFGSGILLRIIAA